MVMHVKYSSFNISKGGYISSFLLEFIEEFVLKQQIETITNHNVINKWIRDIKGSITI